MGRNKKIYSNERKQSYNIQNLRDEAKTMPREIHGIKGLFIFKKEGRKSVI